MCNKGSCFFGFRVLGFRTWGLGLRHAKPWGSMSEGKQRLNAWSASGLGQVKVCSFEGLGIRVQGDNFVGDWVYVE